MKVRLLLALSIIGTATGFVLPIFAQDTVDPKIAEQVRACTMKFMDSTVRKIPSPPPFFSVEPAARPKRPLGTR